MIRRVAALVAIALFAVMSPAPRAKAADNADSRPFILHLNGVGGERMCDHTLIDGLKAAGIDCEAQFYDWTNGQEGFLALQAYDRNRAEAKKIGAILAAQIQAHPKQRVIVTAHSAGTGLAAWALEGLPAGVQVDSVYLFAPALSPEYDLSAALRHVKNRLYVFSSPHDTVVLDAGTRLFGTIDRKNCPAAGLNGFVRPAGADEEQYRKLSPQPYDARWLLTYGNAGAHISALMPTFARYYVAKLMLTGIAPVIPAAHGDAPATRPARAAASAEPLGEVNR